MMKALFLAQPNNVEIKFDLATVNWWIFVIVLAVFYLVVAFKKPWARTALVWMAVLLAAYIGVDQFLLPALGVRITT